MGAIAGWILFRPPGPDHSCPHTALRGPSGGRLMKFEDRVDGDYRIYAGALDVLRGDGYIAAVVVNRMSRQHLRGQEVFRDESLACGHRWPSADEALMFALCRAREWIGQQGQQAPERGDQRTMQA